MKFATILALTVGAAANWTVNDKMGGISPFTSIKISGNPQTDKHITLSGSVARTTYCPGCLEQLFVWLSYHGHEYKVAIEPTLVKNGSRSQRNFNFSVNIPTHPDPEARKVYAKQGIELQYGVPQAVKSHKSKATNAEYGQTVATWELPCHGAWSAWSKCVNNHEALECGTGTSYSVFTHSNDDDAKNCPNGNGDIRMKECSLAKACPKVEEELEFFFL